MGIPVKYLIPFIATGMCLYFSLPAQAQSIESEIEVVAVGDILLDRGVRRRIDQFGTGYPFEKTAGILSESDLTFGNFENPITGECEEQQKKYLFRAAPEHSSILSLAGFDILSIANNHILDCGKIGLRRTIELLGEQKIVHVGAEIDSASDRAAIIEIKGIRLGFAAFTAISPLGPGESYSLVAKADPGEVARTVKKLQGKTDVIIVSFHWGTEYAVNPNGEQIDLARIAVESGADVVLGHHPHVLQGIRMVGREAGKRKSIIAYSLGNFVFDSPVRLNRLVGESMILKLRIGLDGLLGAEIVPVTIDGYRPLIARGSAKVEILERVGRLSKAFGTKFCGGRIVIKDDTSAEEPIGNE